MVRLAMLSDLGAHWSTVMRAEIDPRSTVQALSAWDLDAVREALPRVRGGVLADA